MKTVTWTLWDNTAELFSCQQTITVLDETPPVFINPPLDITVECGQIPEAEITAEDNCGNSEVQIEIIEQEFSGACYPTIYRLFMAEDACGNIASHSQYITVLDSTAPTILNQPEDITLNCGEEIPEYTPEATDNCTEDFFIEFFENETILTCEVRLEQIWIISDQCGNTASASRILTFIDQSPPELVSDNSPLTIECGEEIPIPTFSDDCGEVSVEVHSSLENGCETAGTITFTATDNCGNLTVVERDVTILDSTPPLFSANPAVEISCGLAIPTPYTEDCSGVNLTYTDSEETNGCGEFLRTWQATDECGNTSEFLQTITYSNSEPPVFQSQFEELNLSCSELPFVELPEAITNCGSLAEVTFTDDITQNSCGYTILRTWSAEDSCGNSALQFQTIQVTDTTPPTITGAETIAAECGADIGTMVTVEDDCSDFININFIDNVLSNNTCQTEVEREYTVTDICGNTATFTQIISFVDTEAPLFSPLQNVVIGCVSNLNQVALADATDSCTNTEITFTDEFSGEGCAQLVTRTYTATDACGNSSSLTQLIEIRDEEPPVFNETLENLVYSCGDTIEEPAALTAVDNCSSIEITFEENSEQDACGNTIFLRTWTATDLCGNSSTQEQLIEFLDTEAPIFTSNVEDVTLQCGQEVIVPEVEAIDNCSSEVSIQFSEVTSPGGCPNLIRTWTATDLCGNSSFLTQNVLIEDNEAPVIEGVIPNLEATCSSVPDVPTPQVTDNCDDEVNVTLTESYAGTGCETQLIRQWIATDNCGNTTVFAQTITLTDTEPPLFLNPIEVTAVECEDLATLALPEAQDDCAGEVQITFTDEEVSQGCEAEIVREYTATDLCGNTASFTQTIHLVDLTPPVFIEIPASTFVECGSVPEVATPEVMDNCSAADPAVEFSEITFDTGGGCSFTIQRNWTATDVCGNSASISQYIFVNDTQSPVFTSPPQNTTADCETGASPAEDILVEDNCAENIEINFQEESMNTVCGEFITRTWTATDNCGNQAIHEQTIEVTDFLAPEITDVPADVEVNCGSIPEVTEVSVSDNCDDSPWLVFNEEVITENCPYEIIRSWRAIDDCGNETMASQTITVIDTEVPQFINAPEDMTAACNAVPKFVTVEAVDNCTAEVPVEFSEELIGELCNRSLQRTWTATDFCGNKATHVQLIHLIDNSAPIVEPYDEEIFVECSEELELEELVFTDDCFGLDISWIEEIEESECQPSESWVLDVVLEDEMFWAEWSENGGTYKDDLGTVGDNYLDWSYYKLSEESKLIGAIDYSGSELNLSHNPIDYTYGFQVGNGANNRNSEYGISGWFSYQGTLDGEFVFGVGDLIAELKCCPDHDLVRIWTVSDCAGNSTTVTQIIHVREELALFSFETWEVTEVQFDVLSTEGPDFVISLSAILYIH